MFTDQSKSQILKAPVFFLGILSDLFSLVCCISNLIYTVTFKTHQEQGRSYKEVCAPVIERLRFLFNELRPAVCNDLSIMSKLKSLSSLPRWRRVVQKIIREKRKKRGKKMCIHYLHLNFCFVNLFIIF